MDKVKSNFIIVVVVLIVLCVVLAGYAAGLNGQLGAEKTKVMQLNDQIAGLKAKASDLETQLASLTVKDIDRANLAANLQNSLSAANTELGNFKAELENLKTAYAILELKLKAQVPAKQ
jgi:chromosome segregation ATPase